MMRNLEIERVTLAAMSVGIARRSIEVMNRYASERTSFGKPLREFGQIQRYLSQSYAEYMAGRAYTYFTAASMDLDQAGRHRLDSDGVKLFTSAMGKEIADRAIQVLGGYGYVVRIRRWNGFGGTRSFWRSAAARIEAHQKNMCRELHAGGTPFVRSSPQAGPRKENFSSSRSRQVARSCEPLCCRAVMHVSAVGVCQLSHEPAYAGVCQLEGVSGGQ